MIISEYPIDIEISINYDDILIQPGFHFYKNDHSLDTRLHFYLYHNNKLYSVISNEKFDFFTTLDDYDLSYSPGKKEIDWIINRLGSPINAIIYTYDPKYVEENIMEFSEYETDIFRIYNRDCNISNILN